ncbi:MAG: hypothetical protein JWL61_2333 [Gemmatimonadetes bacterium]|nr:hypothetical protein [Gemmatimonadota bacterium]
MLLVPYDRSHSDTLVASVTHRICQHDSSIILATPPWVLPGDSSMTQRSPELHARDGHVYQRRADPTSFAVHWDVRARDWTRVMLSPASADATTDEVEDSHLTQ